MPGAIDFLNNALLDDANFLNVKCLWDVENASSFTKALQYILADYYQNCLVQIPYDFQDERTFFCEVIIPMLKTFAIHNKNSWLHSSDYRPKNIETRFLDGCGISDDRGIAVMIESSGAESNATHSVEDSIRQHQKCDRLPQQKS